MNLDRFAKTNADLKAGIASGFCSQARTAKSNHKSRKKSTTEQIQAQMNINNNNQSAGPGALSIHC